MSTIEDVPVLIVGGGGCGLASALLLANLGVDALLVERNLEAAILPRAHILNQRTMEIFAQHGLAEPVYREGAPLESMRSISFRTSLGGDGPLDRRLIGRLDGYGGGALQARYDADCGYRATNLPLNRLEPLLRALAQPRQPGRVRFGHELVAFEQDADGVSATVRDLARGGDYAVRARYLIAADGGKTIGRTLGVEMIGPRRLRRMVNAYFSADLAPWLDDDGDILTYFMSPDGQGVWAGGGLLKCGPTRWDRHSETWVFMREVSPDDPEKLDESSAASRIRELFRLPELALTVHKVGRWEVEGVAASRYRHGRIFLAGDAAHRHPPVSALGLNTAFGDAHNLAWKLALVLRGRADDRLLDTYSPERQPVGARVAEWALNGFRMRSMIDAAIGLAPGGGEANRAAFAALFADTPGGATRRAIVAEAIRTQRIGPQAHDMEIGYAYEAGALVPDGTPAPERDPFGLDYRPDARPGARLPHAWLRARDGRRVSTHELVPRDGFALFVHGEPGAWREGAGAIASARGVRLDVVAMSEYADTEGNWARQCGIGADGAVLARPDAHVAWRCVVVPAVSPADGGHGRGAATAIARELATVLDAMAIGAR